MPRRVISSNIDLRDLRKELRTIQNKLYFKIVLSVFQQIKMADVNDNSSSFVTSGATLQLSIQQYQCGGRKTTLIEGKNSEATPYLFT